VVYFLYKTILCIQLCCTYHNNYHSASNNESHIQEISLRSAGCSKIISCNIKQTQEVYCLQKC
jgi:hypothetical protein